MKKFTFGIPVLVLLIGIIGCSRKKNTFINRNYHSVTAEYNTLFNGNLALQQGKNQIDDTYFENYWDILPVERMQVDEGIALSGTSENEFFKTAEDKAAKAIQKHSMLIGGKEQNPEMDEAYLLLGKARYYDQRFIPALEAFNYVLFKYPASNNINKAQIWREKTNLRLGNDILAIKNLKRVLKFETLSNEDRSETYATLAQAYVNSGSPDSALVPMKRAAALADNNDKKGRYYFIEGQLYNRLNMRDSANYAFNKVIDLNRKTPRDYYINAEIAKTRNFNFSENDPRLLLQKLQDLAGNRENRPYLDKIYFQFAEYYNHIDSTARAVEFYNKSLIAASDDNFMKSLSYETLGNINFDEANYRNASAYYDSTLTKIQKNTRDYFVIQRKRDNLKDVITYEQIAEENDSILNLVGMNGEQRMDYFTRYAEGLKEKAVAQAEKGAVANTAPELPSNPTAPPSIGSPNAGNIFYFYNPSRVAYGMQEFLRSWGKRELKDNWRTASGTSVNAQPGELDEVSNLIIENNPKYDPQTYLSQIPTDQEYIDSLEAQRNDAYYHLGLIYKEKYKKNSLAAKRLNALLNFTNNENLVAPANYYLYEIAKEEGNLAEAEKYKNTVLISYPDSKFAENIRNPGLLIAQGNILQEKYNTLYKMFENGQFIEVLDSTQVYTKKSRDPELLPKLEMLNAMAQGRLLGLKAYKKALVNVATQYPQSETGKKAVQLLETAIPGMENLQFKTDTLQQNIKLVYTFSMDQKDAAQKLQDKIDKAITDLDYSQLSTSMDIYTPDTLFIMIHGLNTQSRALGFAELLKNNKKYKITKEPVPISSENYRIVQLYKNFDEYLGIINQP